jgi:zona occludens toxin
MAAVIYHGAPGSFKSANAVWNELLPALRKGRLVVTNIEGLLSREEIEIELNEVFPEGAEIWRLSSQTDKGKFLWMRWFWWMPVGALIILDEVQDVFPADVTVFKPVELDSQGIDSLQEKLPDGYYERYYKSLTAFTPDDQYTDDTGDIILDEKGLVIYPKTMREANMRHRKYNWDLVYCTPEITEIHKLVRAVCENGYKHRYMDGLEFIPYFYRRVRLNEHSPKSNGETIKKSDTVKWRKIPLDVHTLYKSTSTGKVTARRGINPLKNPSFMFTIALLLLALGFIAYYFIFKSNDENVKKVLDQGNQILVQDVVQTTKSNSISSSRDDTYSIGDETYFPLDKSLPYGASVIYLNGYVDVIVNKQKSYKNYLFTAIKDNQEMYLTESDLYYFDIQVRFVNPCKVQLKSGKTSYTIRCVPNFINNNSDPADQVAANKPQVNIF